MKIKKQFSLAIIFFEILSGLVVSIESNANDNYIPSSAIQAQAVLGTGYDTVRQRFKGRCIVGDIEFSGLPEATLRFSQTIRTEQLEEELGFQAKARARIGIIEASAAAKFLSQSKSDGFSINAIYSSDYFFKNSILTNPRPTETANHLRDFDDQWNSACGDYFVQQLRLGGKIYFAIRIEFASQADKRAFEAEFSVQGGMFSAQGALQTASQRFSSRTQVTVSAYQIGGNVTQLSRIFGNQQAEAMNFVKCSLGEFQHCGEVLRNAIHYATQEFPRQFNDGVFDPARPDGPAVLGYLISPKEEAHIRAINPPQIQNEVNLSRDLLDTYLEQYHNDSARVENLLSGSALRLSPRQREVLTQNQKNLLENKRRIQVAFQNCWERPDLACVEGVDRLNPAAEGGLFNFDPAILRIESETFAQFCDEGLSPRSGEALQETIRRLIDHAKNARPAAFPPDQVVDECAVAEQVIQSNSSLSLEFGDGVTNRVRDIRPILGFDHLEELNLTNNGLDSIAAVDHFPIMPLPQLKKLELRGNQLTHLRGLTRLHSLEMVDLKSNRLRSADELTALPRLKWVDLRNNIDIIANPFPEIQENTEDSVVCRTGKTHEDLGQFVVTQHLNGGLKSRVKVAAQLGGRQFVIVVGSSPDDVFAGLGLREANRDPKSLGIYISQTGEYRALEDSIGLRLEGQTVTPLADGNSVLIMGGRGVSYPVIIDVSKGIDQYEIRRFPESQWHKRSNHTATLLQNGKVLVTGGFRTDVRTRSPALISSALIFNPEDGSVEYLNPGLSLGRADHTATLLPNGQVILIGGRGGEHESVRTADVYDPAEGSKIKPLIESRMTEGRYKHQSIWIEHLNKILITGGYRGKLPVQSAEFFDPQRNQFKLLENTMSEPRAGHCTIILSNGLILLTGGFHAKGEGDDRRFVCLSSAEIFDPVTKEFENLASSMSQSCADHSMVEIGEASVLVVRDSACEIFNYGN